jgi:hypothetical protein
MSLYYKIWIGAIVKIKRNSIRRRRLEVAGSSIYGNSNGIKFNVLICDPSKNIAQHFYDLDINLFSVEF